MRMQVSLDLQAWRTWVGTEGYGLRSVKWVGLFGATALVGLYTIEDLWNKFGDLRMPKVNDQRNFAQQGKGLIDRLAFDLARRRPTFVTGSQEGSA